MPKTTRLTLVERNLVEYHFEANRTSVDSYFGRKKFGRISFSSKQVVEWTLEEKIPANPDFGRNGLW
jgi:hypothetical protein